MQHSLKTARGGGQPAICNIPASFTWILLTLLASVAVVAFGSLRAPGRTSPRPSPAQIEVRIATTGFDGHHRRLPFTIYVLTDRLSWTLESTAELQGGGTFLSPELAASINRARDVFCVGTASVEGATPTEEARAAQRARQLAEWVKTAIGSPRQTRVFTLNAGQYRGPRELASSYQRRAVILVAGPHEDDVNMSEGLRSGLEQQQQASPLIYMLLHQYSRSLEWLSPTRISKY
jgi:hypothetical protein